MGQHPRGRRLAAGTRAHIFRVPEDAACQGTLGEGVPQDVVLRIAAAARRNPQGCWRDPVYLFAKNELNIAPALLIGFTLYKTKLTIQGTQNNVFAVFMSLLPCLCRLQQAHRHYFTRCAPDSPEQQAREWHHGTWFNCLQPSVHLPVHRAWRHSGRHPQARSIYSGEQGRFCGWDAALRHCLALMYSIIFFHKIRRCVFIACAMSV